MRLNVGVTVVTAAETFAVGSRRGQRALGHRSCSFGPGLAVAWARISTAFDFENRLTYLNDRAGF